MFKFIHFYLPALKFMKMCFTAEELKSINEGTSSAVKSAMEAAEARLKAQYDEQLKASEKKVADITEKMTAMEKEFAKGKGFNIGSGNFPKNFEFMGKSYNIEAQGDLLNDAVASSPKKSLHKIFGQDNEKYYNFKKWAIVTYLANAFQKNHEIQNAYQNFMAEHRKANEMVEGTPALGGYGVPVQYEPEFILLAKTASFALNECSVMNIGTNSVKFPKELTGTTVYYPGEATAPTESNPTQAQLSISVLKAMILTEGISNELISDSMFDLVGYLTTDMTYAMGQNYDEQVLNGNSSIWGANIGLLTSAITNAVTLGGSSFANLTDEDLSLALVTISDEAEQKAKWIMNKKLFHYVRTIKDNTGRNIFQPSNIPGSPPTIWEAPVIKSSKATSTDGAATAFAVVGDLKQFLIVRNPGTMSIESDPYTDFAKDMVRFRLKDRHGLGIKRAGDFCKVVTKA